MTYREGLEKEDAIVMVKKIIQELKWFLFSLTIVVLTIGTLYGVANFSQWRVNVNVARHEAGQVDVVTFTSWR